jgi:hypothetical protein
MKWFIVLVAMPVWAQFGNVDESVTHLVTSGMVTGFELKALSRTGDAAGRALTRYVAGINLDAATIDRLLGIVHMSFGSPAWVEHVADREPTATLPLLAYLDGQTRDDAVRKKIADERVFVLDQVAKLKVGTTCLISNFTAANAGRATVENVQLSKVYRLLIESERINAAAWPRMGDRAAGFLTRLMETCTLDVDDTRRVLSVIRWSFESRGSTADQTLLLLQALQASGDAAEIDATRQYVLAQIH